MTLYTYDELERQVSPEDIAAYQEQEDQLLRRLAGVCDGEVIDVVANCLMMLTAHAVAQIADQRQHAQPVEIAEMYARATRGMILSTLRD